MLLGIVHVYNGDVYIFWVVAPIGTRLPSGYVHIGEGCSANKFAALANNDSNAFATSAANLSAINGAISEKRLSTFANNAFATSFANLGVSLPAS